MERAFGDASAKKGLLTRTALPEMAVTDLDAYRCSLRAAEGQQHFVILNQLDDPHAAEVQDRALLLSSAGCNPAEEYGLRSLK